LNKNNYPVANQLTVAEALNRAHAHWNAGQTQQAEQLCLQALQTIPHQSEALHLLGLMAHAYGRLDLAIDYLRKAGLPPWYRQRIAAIWQKCAAKSWYRSIRRRCIWPVRLVVRHG
jgi:tetratricopeptide (TPR) repeat protein